MSDITKCKGTDCPLKDNCYRFLAKEEPYQSWFVDVLYDLEEHNCSNYWKIKESK